MTLPWLLCSWNRHITTTRPELRRESSPHFLRPGGWSTGARGFGGTCLWASLGEPGI